MTQSDIEKIARAIFDLDWPNGDQYFWKTLMDIYIRDVIDFKNSLKSPGYTEIL